MGKSVPTKKSFKSTVYSHIQNVDSHIDNVRNSLENLVFTNEKEVERALFKKRIKVVVGLTLMFMVIGTYFSPKGKAEVATFFPTACLGGWNNPHNAEGRPETLDAIPAFSLTNSASLAKDVVADLYCGGFKGDVPTETIPTKIMLTIAWKGLTDGEVQPIVGSSFASSSLEVLDATSSTGFTLDSSSTEATTTGNSIPSEASSLDASTSTAVTYPKVPSDASNTPPATQATGTTSGPSQESTPPPIAPIPAPVSNDASPQSLLYKIGNKLLSLFISTVYALDDSMVVSSTTTASNTVGASTTHQVMGTSSISLLPVVTSTSTSQTQVTNPMFEVLYTLDGQNWFSLGKVSAEDMSYNRFEIPVTSSSTWKDISNIQIKIKSLVTPDSKPTVLIDGMLLDVEYEKIATSTEQLPQKADPKRYDMKMNNTSIGLYAAIIDDPEQGLTLSVVASSSGSLVIYKDKSGGVVFSSGIGVEPLLVNSYIFDPGTFTVIVTQRVNGCLGLTSKACEKDKDTIGSVNFTITPTADTPTKYVHTE